MGKKKLENVQLEKVTGGQSFAPGATLRCPHCTQSFVPRDAEHQTIQEGCSEIDQYKCTHCHEWVTDNR